MGQEFSDVAQVSAPRGVQVEIPAEDATDEHVSFEDKLLEGLAEALGYTELAGVRYPVKAYQFRVSEGLTRGSRLTVQDIEDLAKRGYKGVVNLCKEYDDSDVVTKAGMHPLHLKIVDNIAPPVDLMIQFLDFVSKTENQPAYVHCEAGKGRTGCAVATYRLAVMHYTAQQAIDDGKKFGLELKDQINYIIDFYNALQAGKHPGYPLPQGWPGSRPASGDIAGHADNPSASDAKNEWDRADDDDANQVQASNDEAAAGDGGDEQGSPAA
jgi:protein tyrosine phosphatase (PTP) superfamily phosphohydrolase (DUF442 family)